MSDRLWRPFPFLVVLAGAAWLIVGVQAYYGAIGLVELVTALMFTIFVLMWPLVAGWRRDDDAGWAVSPPCMECGAPGLAASGLGFCIRCGAIPRHRANRM